MKPVTCSKCGKKIGNPEYKTSNYPVCPDDSCGKKK